MIYWLVAASLVPALAIIVYFYRSDRFPEPKNTIAGVAVMGALSTFAVVPLQFMIVGLGKLWSFPFGLELFQAFVVAAFVEELVRFLIVLAVAQTSEFDEPMDGPVYAVAIAMGFAAVENLAYVAGGGMEVAVARATTAVPAHAANGLVMGYLVALGRFLPRWRREFYGLALAIPIALHGTYNACLMVSEAAGSGASFQQPLQLVWILGLLIQFDAALRLHRHLAVMQFDRALPWWIGQLPFGRESPRIDRFFRRLVGLTLLEGIDLAELRAAVERRGRGTRDGAPQGPLGPARFAGSQSPRVYPCPHCGSSVATVWLRPGEPARCPTCGEEAPVPPE